MRFSLGRGAIFRKNRLSMLELQKQSFGGALGEAFWGRKWKQNQKNEDRVAFYVETFFCAGKNTEIPFEGGGPAEGGMAVGKEDFRRPKT